MKFKVRELRWLIQFFTACKAHSMYVENVLSIGESGKKDLN